MSLLSRLSTHYSLQGYTQGLFLAVITLFLVEKGLSLWQVGVCFGLYGLTAAILELPLGATADIKGRIRVFRWSLLANIAGFLIAALSQQFYLILFAISLLGFARALESGSISAWEIEQFNKQGLSDRTESLLGRIQATQALGIALGALSGGYLPTFFNEVFTFPSPTTVNLYAVALLNTLHFALLPLLFTEGDSVAEHPQTGVKGQIQVAIQQGWQRLPIRSILTVVLVLGIAMSNVESFWQPFVKAMMSETRYEWFGWITTGYFASAAIGPALYSALVQRWTLQPTRTITLLLFAVAALLILMAFSGTIWNFVIVYLPFIAVIACINIPTAVILNQYTDDQYRSTMHSVLNFALMCGGMISAFGLSFLASFFGIAPVWLLIGLFVSSFALLRLLMPNQKPEQTTEAA